MNVLPPVPTEASIAPTSSDLALSSAGVSGSLDSSALDSSFDSSAADDSSALDEELLDVVSSPQPTKAVAAITSVAIKANVFLRLFIRISSLNMYIII